MSGSPAVLRGLAAHIGCPDPRLGQFDFETPIEYYEPAVEPMISIYDTWEMGPGLPAEYNPEWASDFGTAPESVWTALPDGSLVDMTDANVFFDEAAGMNYQMAWDGTVIYDDGTALKPNGDIMLSGGTVVHADYSMTLTNGETIASAVTMPDGSSSGFNLDQAIKTGLSITQAALQVLGKLGVATTPPRTTMSSGQVAPASSGWVGQNQYRMANGALVQPQQLANGLYQLPDGSVVGAPPPSFFGLNTSTLLMVGAGAIAIMALRR